MHMVECCFFQTANSRANTPTLFRWSTTDVKEPKIPQKCLRGLAQATGKRFINKQLFNLTVTEICNVQRVVQDENAASSCSVFPHRFAEKNTRHFAYKSWKTWAFAT